MPGCISTKEFARITLSFFERAQVVIVTKQFSYCLR